VSSRLQRIAVESTVSGGWKAGWCQGGGVTENVGVASRLLAGVGEALGAALAAHPPARNRDRVLFPAGAARPDESCFVSE
jgi:hypothetical protein